MGGHSLVEGVGSSGVASKAGGVRGETGYAGDSNSLGDMGLAGLVHGSVVAGASSQA